MMKDNPNMHIQNTLIKTSAKGTNIPTIINEIDNYYKQGTLAYAEGVSRYKVEIQKLLNQIDDCVKAKEKEETSLKVIEQELAIDTRFLERLQDDFIQKLHSIEELNTDYKDVVEASEYSKLLKRKTKELHKVQDEIEELELSCLNYELGRINQLEVLEPKRREIEILNASIKELELEKEYFSSTKLHQLPLIGLSNTAINLDDGDMVDTDIV